MNVLIAGDFCPQDRVSRMIETGQGKEVFSEIKEYISEVDYSILNLECPIVENNMASPIDKCGPNLKCSSVVVDVIKEIGFLCVTLGNNHIYDYGEEGVKDTISVLKKNVDYVGAGVNLVEASKILYKNIGGVSVAVINACEHEFSIASSCSAGANPIDVIHMFHAIREARQNADYVLVIAHGGVEHYQLPTIRMKELYRFFVEVGADAVVNHHQHCYTGYEVYKGRPIFYGIGNFCFDNPKQRKQNWNEGYMVLLRFEKNEISYELMPYIQCDENPRVSWMESDAKDLFMQRIAQFNKIISDDLLLATHEKQMMSQSKDEYLLALEPYNSRLMRGLYRRHLIPSIFSKKKRLQLMNYIFCESHLERLIYAVKNFDH